MKGSILAVVFLLGIGIGVAGALLGPDYIEPYLPKGIRAKKDKIEGKVRAKQLKPDRLLLTVLTPEGAVLVTFTSKITEINLLVEQEDLVTLALRGYKPFVSNPLIVRVRKDENAPPALAPLPLEKEPLKAPAANKPAPPAEKAPEPPVKEEAEKGKPAPLLKGPESPPQEAEAPKEPAKVGAE